MRQTVGFTGGSIPALLLMHHAFPPAPLAVSFSLAGSDLLIILLLVVTPCIGTVLLFLFLGARKSKPPRTTRQPPSLDP